MNLSQAQKEILGIFLFFIQYSFFMMRKTPWSKKESN